MNTEIPKTEQFETQQPLPERGSVDTEALSQSVSFSAAENLPCNLQSPGPASLPEDPNLKSQFENQKSPYSSFAQFTRDQLLQISAWLDDHTYDEVTDLIKKEYGPEISKSALQRFYSKTAFKNHLAQTPETAEAAAQVLEFAATGQPNFTDASLRVLEQTAFQLSPTCHKQPADLDTLNRITTIICRQKNTAVRERQAKVQEDKNQLRAAELESKKQLAEKRFDLAKETLAFRQQQHQDLINLRAASSPSPLRGERAGVRGDSDTSQPQSDHLGRLARTLDDVERRACTRFNLPYTGSTNSNQSSSRDDEAHESSSATSSQTPPEPAPCPITVPHNPSSIPNPNLLAPPRGPGFAPASVVSRDLNTGGVGNALDTGEGCSSAASAFNDSPSVQKSALPTLHSAMGSSPLITDHSITDHSIAHSPAQTTKSAPEINQSSPAPSNLQSAICDLPSTVDSYTVKRAQEYWAYRRQYSAPPPPRKSHPQYITQYRHCPCGAACPCPVHENKETFGPFPASFWTSSPHSDFYYEPLIARGLPYRDPQEFL